MSDRVEGLRSNLLVPFLVGFAVLALAIVLLGGLSRPTYAATTVQCGPDFEVSCSPSPSVDSSPSTRVSLTPSATPTPSTSVTSSVSPSPGKVLGSTTTLPAVGGGLINVAFSLTGAGTAYYLARRRKQ